MFAKLIRHARNGTLLKVARTKLRQLRAGNPGVGDSYYGDAAALYEDERQGKAYWDDQQKVAVEMLSEYPDGITVLDVPFGTGRFVDDYVAKDMKVLGLEASPEMVAAAIAKRPEAADRCDVTIGDARSLPYEDNSVDLVMCFRFLSEIISFEDAKTVIREIHRVTRKDAILDLGHRDTSLVAKRRPPRPEDRMGVSLDEQEVRAMLRELGFEVVEVRNAYKSGDGHRACFHCRKI